MGNGLLDAELGEVDLHFSGRNGFESSRLGSGLDHGRLFTVLGLGTENLYLAGIQGRGYPPIGEVPLR